MERTDQPWSSSYTYQVSKHSAEMLHNLNTQRKDGGRFCDVILRVGEDSFPAHKAVLAACSEYFESVFSCQAEDGGEGKELEMHTISPKVFRDILDFAYTSKIVVRLECFPELMTAAKFLLMRSVIEICQEVIKQSNVQILVPPSRGGEHSLFRSPGAAEQLSHPVDMSNGSVSNGAVFTNNNDSDSADPTRANNSSQPTVPEADDRLPVSPLEFSSNHLNSEGSPGSKRARGRPKKESASEPITYNTSAHNESNQHFSCGVCGKVFPDEVQLRNHETQHGTFSGGVSSGVDLVAVNGPTLISQSQARFQQNGLPADSRKRERTRRHVACDLCGKVFRDVYHLNRHKLSHSGEKPYACPVCGLRFKRKDRMSYHVRSHDGSVGKPYVCQSCGKGFSRPDHLNGHIKQVHTTERPHKCQTGRRMLGNALTRTLMVRMQFSATSPTETDLKPEEKPTGEDLEVTSFIFNGQSDNAVTTQGGSKLKMDPEKKFACAECGQTFRTKSYLNKHHHRVHKKRAAAGSNLGNLGSPFSPQQNMSLLESFGFQIVQSAFASSLVDSEMGGSGIDLGDK
ncbi:Zinc finger transcription factor [Triplophysa tibetana]|uniref:Zinc finger transcription factor n=1 Tax=Triplophysa tibetana TaxID=1572043 RepID=A0A5A9NTQ0_9TELE|nr:Zinc finger transcription factor [Triplophysa tibetana]